MNLLVDITKRYLEPHRKYHNLEHITRMLTRAEDIWVRLTDQQVLAIWYHDAIYDPKAEDNEEQSALIFETHAQESGMDAQDIQLIKSIIIDTKTHYATSRESVYVLDLDLLGLADPYEQYVETGKKIRQEYSHLTDSQWRTGRRKFLTRMLARNSIFNDPFIRRFFDDQARQNMMRDLKEL